MIDNFHKEWVDKILDSARQSNPPKHVEVGIAGNCGCNKTKNLYVCDHDRIVQWISERTTEEAISWVIGELKFLEEAESKSFSFWCDIRNIRLILKYIQNKT